MTRVLRIVASSGLAILAGGTFTSISAIPTTATTPTTPPPTVAAGNPYQAIVDRNVFALKPPPPPPDPNAAAAANKPPLPPVALTGLTTIFGTKRAFFSIQFPPGKGEPPKQPESFMLAEGERSADVEMIEIDIPGGTVKLNISGTITNVPFVQMAKSTAPMPGMPGAPGAPGGIPAPPPNPFNPGGASPFNKNIPTRSLRLPGTPDPQAQPGSTSTGSPAGAFGAANDPNVAGGNVAAAPMPSRSAEESVALYEANRAKNEQLRASGVNLPRLPQHPYLQQPGGTDAGAPQQQATPQLPLAPGFQRPRF
jgi:hypothetical protein